MIEILQTAATEAGKTLLNYFGKELAISQKTSHQNIVTEADLASQKIIIDTITALLEKQGINKDQIGFIAEENVNTQKTHLFVIDPLDGTNNFASGHEYFGISIAYFKEEILDSALIYYPFYNTYYYAGKNKGAYKESGDKKSKIQIKMNSLNNSLVATYLSSSKQARDKSLPYILKLDKITRGIRIYGSVVLDCVHFSDPINNINIAFHSHPHIWDIAAGKLIVEEAGGIMTNWQGKPIELDFNDPAQTYEVLICHPQNLSEIIKIISG